MTSKTPNFNKKIEGILINLLPHARTCDWCKRDFRLDEKDLEFCKMLECPPPKKCPECRMQHRMTYNTATLKFYKNTCAAHEGEKVISLFSPKSPFKIYDNNYWWSVDAWDARDFGLVYDSQKPFFDQFRELVYRVPHFAIARYQSRMIQSDYTSHSFDNKNCYFSTMIFYAENVYNSAWVLNSKECVDCSEIEKCESCYGLTMVNRAFDCDYMYNSYDCVQCSFLCNSSNCQNCFMSSNIKNKRYVFRNKELGKEEYELEIKKIEKGKRSVIKELQKEFEEMYQSTFHRATRNIRAINCEGESLSDCKDCYECYWMNESINNRYIESGIVIKDSMDLEAIGPNIEKCYQVCEAQESFGIKFGYFINASVDLEYCYECSDCKYCFGCVGIKKKQFCILNKEYPENEYWALLDEIKSKLLDEGMYGEFFPISCGLYPYNNTFAETNFPLKEEEAKSMGFLWEEKEDPTKIGIELVEANNLPDDINDAADDILQKGIICERSKKPFRVTPFELEFCKKKSIPLPTLHPEERFLDRYKKRSPFKVWTYPCKKCGENTRTSIDPAKNLTIYCETCYQREVG